MAGKTDRDSVTGSGATGLPALEGRRLPAWLQRPIDWLLALPLAARAALAGLVALGILGFVFFLGFVVGERQFFPYTFLSKVDGKIASLMPASPPAPLEGQTLNSALIRIDMKVGHVDTGRPAASQNPLSRNGGGVASFGEDVLVLAYNGNIYAASGHDSIRVSALEAPDNNRAEYQALAEDPDFAQYNFHQHYLRYNDLLDYDTGSERGLIASYTEYHPGRACVTNTLAKLEIPPGVTSVDAMSARAEDWQVIYRTDPCLPFKDKHLAMEGHMAGGRLAFEAPSTVYLTSGDFHIDGMRSEGPGIAQDPDAQYGKVLEVDIATGEGRILSMGHRNAQGIALKPSGDLIILEHGPRGGDELNLIEEGKNYGWPLESYGTTYRGSPIPNALSYGRQSRFEPPIFSWVPSVAASGLTLIEGFHDAWDGDLLAASLTDGALFRIRMEGRQAVYSERIEVGTRIRDVHQHSDGRLVLWTDNGEIIFLSGVDRIDEGERFRRYLSELDAPRRVKADLQTAVDRCAECHSFAVGEHERSPGLNRIFGDPIASTPFEGYSPALSRKSGRWTRENLKAFIENPQEFAAGTSMPGQEISDERVVDELVNYLEELDRQF
mgnify:CR=1 FL=1